MRKKRLLEEIYDKAINNSEYMEYVEHEVNKQLEMHLSAYKKKLSEWEYIRLEEIVVGGVVVTEKVAFMAGIDYGMHLFKEIFNKSLNDVEK